MTITGFSESEYTYTWVSNDTENLTLKTTLYSTSVIGLGNMQISLDPAIEPYFTNVGKESVEAPRGTLVCEHLNYTGTQPTNIDIWIYNGVAMKLTQSYLDGGFTTTLVDTNLEEVISA